MTTAVVTVIGSRAEDGRFIRRANPRRVAVSPGYVLGRRDLGVAHGAPGVIAYLAAVARSGLASASARRLLDPMARWLPAMTIADDDQAVFGVTAERHWQSTRSAWCYGDPGAAVALSLIDAALRDDDPQLSEHCRAYAHRAAAASIARPVTHAGVLTPACATMPRGCATSAGSGRHHRDGHRRVHKILVHLDC